MSINEVIKNRIIKPWDFLWKRFRPSLQTNLFFNKFFSSVYSDFQKYIGIKSIEWTGNSFIIMLVDKNSWEVLHLIIKDNKWKKKCNGILCTDSICTWVHTEIQNDNFLKFIVYFIVKGKNLLFEDLLKILTRDIKAKKEYYQIFWRSERPPFSILHDWNHPLQKYRFLIHEWVMRNLDQSIKLNINEISISHAERECMWISPNNKDKWYHFLNFPGWFYDHKFDKYYYLTDDEKELYEINKEMWNWRWLSTDLNEEDIIMWKWTDKLSELLNYVVNNAENNNTKVVSFNCCCVPRIVWDDIYSLLKKAKEKLNIPFILQWQLEKTPYEQKIELLDNYINKIDKENIIKNKNSISLFWYHENINQSELYKELKLLWIKINTSFIPSIDVRLLPLMFKSELFVFSPNNFQNEIFEYPFQNMWVKYIKPIYPYSVKYSDSWVISIINNLSISNDIKIENIASNLKIEYDKLVNYVKQKKFTIWFFLMWKNEVEKLINPDYFSNIDILYFLEEMGFNINLYIFKLNIIESNSDDINNEEEIINLLSKKSKTLNINFFSDDNEFQNIFKSWALDLVYSDIYFDSRLINYGINQINLKNFYVWYTWAIKTIKGLINLCEMNFFKNYNKYFVK